MQNIFKQLLAPTWQQREEAAKNCSHYYCYNNNLSIEAQQQVDTWLLELGEQKTLYLTAILSFWSHVINLQAKNKVANSRQINAYYQARIDRAACESWRKPDLEQHFPLDQDDEKLQMDWLINPSRPIELVTRLSNELESLQQQLVDTFPILDSSTADIAKRVLSEMPHITDQTYYACLEGFRSSYETGYFQKFAQHMNTPARVEQWCAFYAHENNRDTEILDRYLDIAEYAPQQSASQILPFLIHFYQQQPSVEKTSQLLHAFASLCGSVGNFPTFVVEFAMQVLTQERENKASFWGEQLVYFLSIYNAHTYADDIVYFLDHPIERHHYNNVYAILPIAIKNIDEFPNKIIDKIFLYGLFDGLLDPNFSHTAKFFDFLKMMNPQHLKQFEPTFQNALQNFINDFEDFLVDAINDILPILNYLKKQNIDLNQEIKIIIAKLELFYNEDISESQPTQSMDEILAATKADFIKQGLSDEEAELELQQSMLIMKQLFGVNEDQSLEEKFAQNDLQTSEMTELDHLNEDEILLNQLKQLLA